jgi:hypothetical protein
MIDLPFTPDSEWNAIPIAIRRFRQDCLNRMTAREGNSHALRCSLDSNSRFVEKSRGAA